MLDFLLFSYTTKVILLGVTRESLEIGDLPIVTANMRATTLFYRMRTAIQRIRPRSLSPRFLNGTRWQWRPTPGSGWMLMYRLAKVNLVPLNAQISLAIISALLFYAPAFFLRELVAFLERSKTGEEKNFRWGWVYCLGLFLSNAICFLSASIASYSLPSSILDISTNSYGPACKPLSKALNELTDH